MKRLITFLLALVMLLSLTACGKEPAETKNTQNPYEAHAGKYMIYHLADEDSELNYFQISMSSLADTYIELHADGKISGVMNGKEMPEGNTWNAETLTATNFEGETNSISFQDNALIFIIDGGTMTLLKEGDPRLDDLPTAFEYLHDYIVSNGTQDDRGHTVVCSEDEDGEKYTMTATADGKISWDHFEADGTHDMTMELVQDAQFQTIVILYNEYTCTTTVETATVGYSEFVLSSCTIEPEPAYMASSIQMLVEMRAQLLFMKANSYLSFTVGITMASLGFANYSMF